MYFRKNMAKPLRRTAVLFVGDERSRLVCSLLLRHDGYRVLEARSSGDALKLIRRQDADLVIADLIPSERPRFHRLMLEQAPGVCCLFVRERSTPNHLRQQIDVYTRRDRGSASRN